MTGENLGLILIKQSSFHYLKGNFNDLGKIHEII